MAKFKHLIIALLSVALVTAIAIGGTVAYISDFDEDVSVMTSGNVKIRQNVYQRGENGLEPFVQGSEAYPAVYGLPSMPALELNEAYTIGSATVNFYADGSIFNAIDKIVTVKNTGKSDAFVRTLVLVPSIMHTNYDTSTADLRIVEGVTYKNASYRLMIFTYTEALAPNTETVPSLLQIYVDKAVTQEQIATYLDANGKLVVPALSQAVQTKGFENFGAAVALDEAFGLLSATSNPWVPVEQKWDGDPDTGWYLESRNEFTLTTAGQLAGLSKLVESGVTFAGKTIKLGLDIDLNNTPWTPIGIRDGGGTQNYNEFNGTFDGCGYTIYNLNVKTPAGSYSTGLFGAAGGTIKNLTVANAVVSGMIVDSTPGTSNGIAVIVGSTNNGARVDNVHVINATVSGNRYVGGIVGYMDGDLTNSSVTNTAITATPDLQADGSYDNGDKVGGIAGYQQGPGNCGWYNRKFSGNTVTNVTLKAYRDVGGIVGAAHLAGTSDHPYATEFENNTVNGLAITIDQLTGCYGVKAANANAFVGRQLGLSFTASATNVAMNVTIDEIPFTYCDRSGSLGNALASLSAGDTLIIGEGTYTVSGTHTIPDGVTVIGLGEVTFIQTGSGDDIFACAGDATIINIDFVVNTGWAYAICCSDKRDQTADGNIVIQDCSFAGQEGKIKRYAISKPACGSLTITNCYFDGSTLDVGIGGVKNEGGSVTTITGCIFDNFTGEAIGCVGASVPATFVSDVIANNTGLNTSNVVVYN